MLLVVPASSFKEAEIQDLIQDAIRKQSHSGEPSESIASKSTVWMPYYRIRYEYTCSKDHVTSKLGETALGETALNAMFSGCVRNEAELFTLFRPNYLKHTMATCSLRSNEITGPSVQIDFDAVLSTFLSRLNEVEDEVLEVRSALNKRYARARRYSLILPATLSLRETEKLSEKIAKLEATANVFRLCLNLNENAKAIEVLDNSLFYYPTAIATLRSMKLESERFLIINLVKKGSMLKRLNCDHGLTQLCFKNSACRDLLAKSIAQQ